MKKSNLMLVTLILASLSASTAFAESSTAELGTGAALILGSAAYVQAGEERAAGMPRRGNSNYGANSRAARSRMLNQFYGSPVTRVIMLGGFAGGGLFVDGMTGSHVWNAIGSVAESDRQAKPRLGDELSGSGGATANAAARSARD